MTDGEKVTLSRASGAVFQEKEGTWAWVAKGGADKGYNVMHDAYMSLVRFVLSKGNDISKIHFRKSNANGGAISGPSSWHDGGKEWDNRRPRKKESQ